MEFAVHSSLIGSKRHRLSDGSWVDNIPEDYWIAGTNIGDRDLLTALMLSGKKVEIEPPNPYLKVIRYFTYNESIPWEMVLPSHAFELWAQSVSNKIHKALTRAELSYYENIFKRSCEVLAALKPMKIHGKKWDYLAERDIQGVNTDVINSFEPYETGFADPIKYSLTSTISGRLTVSSGPEILRLNKELKPIIKSRYKGGKIIQFDYVSLEPRLALILAGHKVSEDIYSDINVMVFENKFSRDVVKVATLSVMYGAGAQSLSEKTGFSVSACKKIIKQLKEFFGIHDRSKKLTKMYRSKNIIKNHFGRAMYPESGAGHKLYNHFIQSSAVDAAMLGFWNIIKGIDERIIPIFVIHDNIGLDFPPDLLDKVEEIEKLGAEIPGLDSKLLLGHDKI